MPIDGHFSESAQTCSAGRLNTDCKRSLSARGKLDAIEVANTPQADHRPLRMEWQSHCDRIRV